MANLSELLQQAMRRRHLTPQAVADKTGIRTPRIRAFAEDGAEGPVCPTEEELAELAGALALPLPAVLAAAHPETAARRTGAPKAESAALRTPARRRAATVRPTPAAGTS